MHLQKDMKSAFVDKYLAFVLIVLLQVVLKLINAEMEDMSKFLLTWRYLSQTWLYYIYIN